MYYYLACVPRPQKADLEVHRSRPSTQVNARKLLFNTRADFALTLPGPRENGNKNNK